MRIILRSADIREPPTLTARRTCGSLITASYIRASTSPIISEPNGRAFLYSFGLEPAQDSKTVIASKQVTVFSRAH